MKKKSPSRRDFLKYSAGGVVGICTPNLAWLSGGSATHRLYLRDNISFGMPYMRQEIDRFSARVRALSDGRLEVIRLNDRLTSSLHQHKEDLQISAPFLRESLFPGAMMYSFIPYGPDAQSHEQWLKGSGLEAWRQLYGTSGKFIVFPFGRISHLKGIWSSRELQKPSDFAGMQTLAFGFGGRMFESLGAKVQGLKGSQEAIVQGFRSGKLEAIQWDGARSLEQLGFDSSNARFYLFTNKSQAGTASLEITVNQASLHQLPEDLKAHLLSAIRESDKSISLHSSQLNQQQIRDAVIFPGTVVEKLIEAQSHLLSKVESRGAIQKKIVAGFRNSFDPKMFIGT